MRSIFFFVSAFILSTAAFTQTPIDELQKRNINYLETKESEGYAFRSQIITEFDLEHASQHVNIKLSEDFSYVIVALADHTIPELGLEVKPTKNAKIEKLPLNTTDAGQALLLTPGKSGRFKIDINALGLKTNEKGFISFMVLRK